MENPTEREDSWTIVAETYAISVGGKEANGKFRTSVNRRICLWILKIAVF